jgi:LacI family transcriptional regulator
MAKDPTIARAFPPRVKLADVARAAKVSLATASRALNQPEIVRDTIRKRVEDAVQLLGYTPDRMARALSSGRSHIVGAIVPTLANAIFADGVEALQDGLGARGYTLLLANSRYDPHKELQQIRAFLEHGVDGLVLVGDSFDPQLLPLIQQHGVPVVTTYVCTSRNGLPAIGIDNGQATYKMTRYLLELGHREFGIIANTALPNDRSKARLDGMRLALAEGGVSLAADRVVEVALPSIAYGRRALGSLLTACSGITAILCTNDAVAVGALSEARRIGRNIPRELSIVGFDNIEIAAESDPPLTTVDVPAHEIGRLAAEFLINAIEGRRIPNETKLAAPLIVRESTDRVLQLA